MKGINNLYKDFINKINNTKNVVELATVFRELNGLNSIKLPAPKVTSHKGNILTVTLDEFDMITAANKAFNLKASELLGNDSFDTFNNLVCNHSDEPLVQDSELKQAIENKLSGNIASNNDYI